jgi:hypothetical protein
VGGLKGLSSFRQRIPGGVYANLPFLLILIVGICFIYLFLTPWGAVGKGYFDAFGSQVWILTVLAVLGVFLFAIGISRMGITSIQQASPMLGVGILVTVVMGIFGLEVAKSEITKPLEITLGELFGSFFIIIVAIVAAMLFLVLLGGVSVGVVAGLGTKRLAEKKGATGPYSTLLGILVGAIIGAVLIILVITLW